MNLQQVTENYFVAGQITPEDIHWLKEQGFKVIVNNRPDGEAEGQPAGDAIREAAEAAGMTYHYLPVSPNQLQAQTALALNEILSAESAPVLGFCRTGNRSTLVWKLGTELQTG